MRRFACLLGLWHIMPFASAQTSEYAVKAAFLVSFVKFMEWPQQGDTCVIAVFGSNPFGSALDKAADSKSTHDRRIVVRQFRPDQPIECNLLFVPQSESVRFERARSHVGRGVIIVGEALGFAERLGHVNFIIENKRVAFEINRNTIRASGVTVSSRLLQLAKAVN